MSRSISRALAALALVASACTSSTPETQGDEYVDLSDLSQGLGLACGAADVCTGTSAGPNDLYVSTYRVGTTATSSGELAQTFVATASGAPASVRLPVRSLRAFTPPVGAPPQLHVALYPVASATAPEITGSPAATGDFDLTGAALPPFVDVPLTGSAFTSGQAYALVVTADDVPAGGNGTILLGIGALSTHDYAAGTSFRRSLRRTGPSAQWGESRLRPAGTYDLAFALTLSAGGDQDPPVVTFTTPAAPTSSLPGTYGFAWSATDADSGVSHFDVALFHSNDCAGAITTSATGLSAGTYSAALAVGFNSLRVTAWDVAGNSSDTCSPRVIGSGLVALNVNQTGTSEQRTNLGAIGNKFVFARDVASFDDELWVTDGTAAGTQAIGAPTILKAFGSEEWAVLGGYGYFEGNRADTGSELFRTDGTDVTLVKDVRAGTSNGNIQRLTKVGSRLFFIALPTGTGAKLYVSDGTGPGTTQVSSTTFPIREFADLAGTALISGQRFSESIGEELYKSDGTGVGTVLVKDIQAGGSISHSSPQDFLVSGGVAYFSADDGAAHGRELWKTDGTSAGTVLVKDVEAGAGASNPVPRALLGSTLLFTATTTSTGTELWKSDGTTAGTTLVQDIYIGGGSSDIGPIFVLGGIGYFEARHADFGVELWRTDGTNAGTYMVAELSPTIQSGLVPGTLAVHAGALYFSGTAADGYPEPFRSDGTEAGTVLLKDLRANGSSTPGPFFGEGTQLFFEADDGLHGRELFVSDGTTAGTQFIVDVNTGSVGSDPVDFTLGGGATWFLANDGLNGEELWHSDGTVAGSGLFELAAGFPTSNAADLVGFAGHLVFDAFDGTDTTLWRVNTATLTAEAIANLGTITLPPAPTPAGDRLLFTAYDPDTFVVQLRSSTGAPGPTTLLAEFPEDPSGMLDQSVRAGSQTFFPAPDENLDVELWATNGTPVGTRRVKDLNPSASSYPRALAALGSNVVFSANDGTVEDEPWFSDGTSAGTNLVLDTVEDDTADIATIVPLDAGHALFFGYNGNDYDLWKTDGTAAGTTIVLTGVEYPGNEIKRIGSSIYFIARQSGSANSWPSLWKTDGTPAGTVEVFWGGTWKASNLTDVGGVAYFVVEFDDSNVGRRIWSSDGTTAGTAQVPDLAGFEANDTLTGLDGSLWFAGTTDSSGAEPVGYFP